MQKLASWLGRRLWWAVLWAIRRPRVRRLQTASMAWMRPDRRERARIGLVRQNRFARRIGLPLLTWTILLVLVSLALQLTFYAAQTMIQSGVLRSRREPPPDFGN